MAAMPKEERLSLDEAASIVGRSPSLVAKWAYELGIGRRRLGKLTFTLGDVQRLASRAAWEERRAEAENDVRYYRMVLRGEYGPER
jgi:hypothetical protein